MLVLLEAAGCLPTERLGKGAPGWAFAFYVCMTFSTHARGGFARTSRDAYPTSCSRPFFAFYFCICLGCLSCVMVRRRNVLDQRQGCSLLFIFPRHLRTPPCFQAQCFVTGCKKPADACRTSEVASLCSWSPWDVKRRGYFAKLEPVEWYQLFWNWQDLVHNKHLNVNGVEQDCLAMVGSWCLMKRGLAARDIEDLIAGGVLLTDIM